MLRCFAGNTRGRDRQPRGTALKTIDVPFAAPSLAAAKDLRRALPSRVSAGAPRSGGSPLRVLKSGIALSIVGAACALGGCGMSSLTSGLGGGMFGGSAAKSDGGALSEDQLLAAAKSNDPSATGSTSLGEVAAGCPRFIVAPRDHHVTFYEQGRTGDALAIMHRGEITKTARECQVEPGRVTVKYGFSGRVLLGPKGKPGDIRLPVNVSVNDSKRAKITGETVTVDVVVGLDKPIGYFSAVRTVSFDIPEGSRAGEFELVVGFDGKAAGAG